jgi:hypothetical protein
MVNLVPSYLSSALWHHRACIPNAMQCSQFVRSNFQSITPYNAKPQIILQFSLHLHQSHYFPPAYLLTQLFASFSQSALLFLYCSAMPVSIASSGLGSINRFLAIFRTARMRFGGFHSSERSMPRHMEPFSSLEMLGW